MNDSSANISKQVMLLHLSLFIIVSKMEKEKAQEIRKTRSKKMEEGKKGEDAMKNEQEQIELNTT